MSKRVYEDLEVSQNDVSKRSCGDLNEYENPHFKIGEIVRAFYGGQWYDNVVILTLKPDVAVEWDNGETTENMSKKDLKKLHGMQHQPNFDNPIFHVGEIARAYPVNQKYYFNATICRMKVVTPLWSVGIRRDQTILQKV